MKNIGLIIACYCCLLIPLPNHAQDHMITRYADDNGLPSRIVRDVMQDKQGFIWVAGNNGLFRFDGQHFKSYMASLKDTIGLRDNKINAILQTSDEKIWIGTPKGLHMMENDSITHISLVQDPTDAQEHVLHLFEDDAQNLWVGTYGGLFFLDESREAIHFLSEKRDLAIAEGVVWGVSQGDQGEIWVAGSDGPYIMEKNSSFLFKKLELEIEDGIKKQEPNFFAYQKLNDSY